MTQPPSAPHPLILVVENDPGNRVLAERILALAGYAALTATNGLEALQILEREPIDLILTDLSMPVMDGFSVIRILRQRPEFARVPIVALTAHAMGSERQQALQIGCTAIVIKPYRPQELIRLVQRLLAEALPA